MPSFSRAHRWRHRAKRWLFLTHRWVGIVTCLLMLVWFLSGIVMMYVPFPQLEADERLAGLPRIDWRNVAAVPPSAPPGSGLVLEQRGFVPVWRFRDDRDGAIAASASTGRRLPMVEAYEARLIAEAFARSSASAAEPIERDQWTVAGGYDAFRPLWKVSFGGDTGRVLYVSSSDGQVVLDTSARERMWNWLGAVPHWMYPTVLRQNQPLWRQAILWTAGFCIVGAVSGLWIGILRLRLRRRYKGGRTTPYRGWQYWHHIVGLAGGTLLATWIASGWLSVDPGRWFENPGLHPEARTAYELPQPLPPIDWRAVSRLPEARKTKRVRLAWVDGRPLVVLERPGLDPSVREAGTLAQVRWRRTELLGAAARLMPGRSIRRASLIERTDAHWYRAKGSVELPVLRVVFDDPAKTWVHISPLTGEIVGESDARRRLYRWLYDGLHRWDFDVLLGRRPLWDIWMLIWLGMGLIVTASGVVIAFRRLARPGSGGRKRGRLRGVSMP